MLDANTLMAKVGGGSDQVNLMELVSYLKESKLARKVSGFAEKTAEVTAKKGQFPTSWVLRAYQRQNRTEQDRPPPSMHP